MTKYLLLLLLTVTTAFAQATFTPRPGPVIISQPGPAGSGGSGSGVDTNTVIDIINSLASTNTVDVSVLHYKSTDFVDAVVRDTNQNIFSVTASTNMYRVSVANHFREVPLSQLNDNDILVYAQWTGMDGVRRTNLISAVGASVPDTAFPPYESATFNDYFSQGNFLFPVQNGSSFVINKRYVTTGANNYRGTNYLAVEVFEAKPITAVGGGGSGVSAAEVPAIMATNELHILYVSPTGNDATARRGDPTRPWKTLFDFDGSVRSGACTVATNLDTIMLLGTNYAAVVPLNEGVTLQGMDTNSALFYTNRMAFTNDLGAWRLGINPLNVGYVGPDMPMIALSARCTVKNLYIDARDNSYVANNVFQAVHYITPFASGVGLAAEYEIWVLDNTNYLPTAYYEYPLMGFTNRPGPGMKIENCTVWANVDVVYFNFYGLSTIYYSSTNSPGYNSGTYYGTYWGATEEAMTWTTNNYKLPTVELTIDRATKFYTYWDYMVVSGGNIYVDFKGEGHSVGLGPAGNGTCRGPVVQIYNDGMYYDSGTHYITAVTNTAIGNANNVVGGPAILQGATFYNSNVTAVAFSTPANVSGHYVNGMTGVGHVIGSAYLTGTSTADSITVTNLLSLRTNYIAANFVPTAGVTKFCPSNNAIYSVSTTKTNQIVAP